MTVAGCDLALTGEATGEATGEPSDGTSDGASDAQSPRATTAAGDPDAALVDEVLAELDAMVGLVTGSAAAAPRLRVPLTVLRDLHLAHAAALGKDSETTTPAPGPAATTAPPGGGSGSTRSRVVTGERRLQRRLADWSVAADSGALARLLASMSASVAQHVVHHLGADPAAAAGAAPTRDEAQ